MANDDKITLSEIRSDVRGLLDDAAFDSVTIDRAANDFQNELFTRYHLKQAESSDTLTVSSGDTRVDFPDDYLTIMEMTVIYSATQYNNIKRHHTNYELFMRDYANYTVATAARPQTWTDFNNGARFTQPSDAAYTINLDYLRLPEMMIASSDESEIRSVWSEMINRGTLARVMEINEDWEEATQVRDLLAPLITTFVAREGRGRVKTGPSIISQGRSRGVYRPDRDFGER